MKKLLFGLALVALVALPAAALAAAMVDVSLGGYTKLDMYWDSSQVGKNLNTPTFRNNDPANQVGRFNATAQSSRFNFTIKGPNLWGAKTSGFIEIDFDQQGDARQTSSHSYVPRMRHAFFRMDWAETQLLMGQYWGMFCNYYPESVQDGPFMFHGQATQRLAQIRVTQKFAGAWTVSALMGKPYDPDVAADNPVTSTWFSSITAAGLPVQTAKAYYAGGLFGQRAEMPQFQVSVDYEQDLYGKAAFYGRPRGFNVNLAFGIQRTVYDNGYINNPMTWGQTVDVFGRPVNNYVTNVNTFLVGTTRFTTSVQKDNQVLTPWVFQATMFIPILTTKTPNLAGTASATVQFYIGQGLSFIGNGRDQDNTYFKFGGFTWGYPISGTASRPLQLLPYYNRHLTKQYGGYIQGQYYFNNEWFINYVYGFQKSYDVPASERNFFAVNPTNPNGYVYLTNQDQVKMWQEHNLALYYRPIQAFKFGIQYSYMRTDYFQKTTVGSRVSDWGENHRVEFGGWFFF